MKTIYIIGIFLVQFSLLHSQNMRKLNREGVAAYKDSAYTEAELYFRKAREADSTALASAYNIANTLYKQEKYEEAGKLFQDLAASTEENTYLSMIHHNLGNSYLRNQNYEKSIEAYKNALRLSPEDDETRYNLAYALKKLQQQEQEQEDQQNQQDQQDQQDQQENNNEEQDQQDQQDQQENNNEEQDQQEQQDQKQDQQDENDRQQQSDAMKSLSKKDMERLLQAIQQMEKEVQEKLEEEKAKAPKTKTEKDW